MSFSESNRNLFRPGVAVVVVVVVLAFFGFFNVPRHFIQSTFQGVIIFLYEHSIATQDAWSALTNRAGTMAALEKCQTEQARITIDAAKLDLLEQENSTLKQQLRFEDQLAKQVVTARVIGNALNLAPGTIMINRGGESGITVDQPVITGDGILVGKISRVEPRLSFVRLVSDNMSKVAVTVTNREKSIGVVEGGYGLSLRLNFVPRNEVISPGDKVVTSGLEPMIPRGLPVGTVAAVENEAYRPFQQAVLTPILPLSKLFIVGVIMTVGDATTSLP